MGGTAAAVAATGCLPQATTVSIAATAHSAGGAHAGPTPRAINSCPTAATISASGTLRPDTGSNSRVGYYSRAVEHHDGFATASTATDTRTSGDSKYLTMVA
jgi:hypothetical protein